ncbi:MAG: ankyrin repeat domain-containing protein [Rickettsia endosymbiont of Pentastiridius leporinus]
MLRDYDKHIFIYDKESYIPTATVIDDHDTRSNKKTKIERIVDGSNAVNSILLISKTQDSPAIVLNIIDANRKVNDVIKLPLDTVTVGNRKIVSLDIEFRLDKSQERFQHCDVEIGKIYNSVLEYNNENIIKAEGAFHKISFKDSVELVAQMKNAIDSQAGLVISESYYKELIGKIGEVVYPIKSLIAKESEFQGLLEGIFKYYSDVKLSEGSERRELVLTEFQTGAGGRIDMLVQAIGSSEQGTKEYIPVGLELKYDDSIKLDSRGRKQDENIQQILLVYKEKQVVEKLLQDQTERYSKGAAIKSITDGNKVAIIGVVFNGQAQEPSKLLLTTNKFIEAHIVHSSKLYTISHGVVVPDINDVLQPDYEGFMPDWVEQEILDAIAKMQGEDETLLSLFNKNINDDKITKLQNVLKHKENPRSIYSIDLSYNEFTSKNILGLVNMLGVKLIYLDLSDNDLAKDNFADFKELISKIDVPVLKISDIGMQNKQMKEVIMLLKKQDKVSHLEIQHLEKQTMDRNTAHSIGRYISNTKILEYLDLSRCGIDDVAAKRISNNLYEQNTLETLILRDNRISVEGALGFKVKLSQSVISHFDLSGNPLGIDGFANIVEGVVSSSSNVKVLKLIDVGVKYDRYNREQAERLVNAIKSLFSNTKLTSVDVSYNDIGTGCLSQIFDILSKARHGHSFRDVSLAGNEIDWGSHQATIDTLKARIGQFFKKNKTIRSLNMADMNLNDELGQEIATGLEKSSLIHLDLSGNVDIGKKTISALCNSLHKNQYLKYLNLSDTKQNIMNIKDLLSAIKSNQDLTHLNLLHNDLSGMFYAFNGGRVLNLDNQEIDFKNLLQGNTSLKYLNVAYCKLSYNSLKSLFALLKEKSSLEVLDIRGNDLDDTLVDYILQGIEEVNKGLNGLKILHVDQGNLSDESISKLKSLGISLLVNDNLYSDIEISNLEDQNIPPPTLEVEGDQQCTISHVKPNIMPLFQETPPLTLEEATNRKIYDYWLQQHDIPDIARVHYTYQVDELEVVGSNDQLSRVLENYRSSQHTHPFTIILNIGENGNGGDHWVSMVLHRVNNEYHAYYTDSFGHEIRGSTASIMNNNNILVHNVSMMQQSDGYNCGLWALENANAIRRCILANNNPESSNLPTINQQELEQLRITISGELHNDAVRTNNLHQYNILQDDRIIPSDYFNNPHIYKTTALILEECIHLATLHLLSPNLPKHKKRSIIHQKPKINAKEFLECTDQMKTDITNFHLMMLLQKLQILDDHNCNKVNQFVSNQQLIDTIKAYKDLGHNVYHSFKQGVSFIFLASLTHNRHLFETICKKYPNQLNYVDHSGQTILHKIVFFPDPNKWVKFLVNINLSIHYVNVKTIINSRDDQGNTALNYAVERGLYEVPKLLVNHGADVNNINNDHKTVLHYAVMNNTDNHRFNVVKLLIRNGAKVNIEDNEGNTALDYANKFNADQRLIEYLIEHDAHNGLGSHGENIESNIEVPSITKDLNVQDISTQSTGIDIAKGGEETRRGGDHVELRKKRIAEYSQDNAEMGEINDSKDLELSGSLLTMKIADYTNYNKHRHHHGDGNEQAKHPINKHYIEDHYRVPRDLEDVLSIKDKKQDDQLLAAQESDSRYDAIVQVHNAAIGINHKIEQDASKFIGSNTYPVVNSVNNKMLIDWQGNLLLGYLLFGKKWGVAKCKTQDVSNDPKDLEYAHRLAYSSYAPNVEKQEEDIELVGVV